MITANIDAMPSGKTDCAISYTTVSITAFRSKDKGYEAIRAAFHLSVTVSDTLLSPSVRKQN